MTIPTTHRLALVAALFFVAPAAAQEPRLFGGLGVPVSEDGFTPAPRTRAMPLKPGGDQVQQSALFDHGDPSHREQYMLELVNRARANPAAEAARLGIALNQGLPPGTISTAPKPPLAFHSGLIASSRNHSLWMLAANTFSHTGAGGSSAGDRMTAAGYPLSGGWTVGENIAWNGSTGPINTNQLTAALHDALFRSPGHRANLMNADFDEIGIGLKVGNFTSDGVTYNALMGTQNFARSGGTPGPLLTGVVYRDQNRNGRYNIGEGVAGINVRLASGGDRAVTSTSGGYALPHPGSGAQRALLTGSLIGGSFSRPFTGVPRNVKVDQNVLEAQLDAGDDLGGIEGTTLAFSGSYVDADPGSVPAIVWAFGDGATARGTLSPRHAYRDDGVYTATLTVTDTDGVRSDSLRVRVANANPIVAAGADRSANEGKRLQFSGNATDRGTADILTYTWNFGDGTHATGRRPIHAFADNGRYNVTLTVTDGDGGVGTDRLRVTVANVAPTADAGPDRTISACDCVSFSCDLVDPGTADTHSCAWAFGDGDNATGPHAIHCYDQERTYVVTLTVVDDDGGRDADTARIIAGNAAPDAEAGPSQAADPGETVRFRGSHTDCGNSTGGYHYAWDFGDGGSANGRTATHVYSEDGRYRVRLTVTDAEGARGMDWLTVEVGDVICEDCLPGRGGWRLLPSLP